MQPKQPSFYLLGAADAANPRAISLEEIRGFEREGAVVYFGESSDVREVLELCDCVVLPSYKEGVPRVLLEAMACGRAIITTNVAGCKECVNLGESGESRAANLGANLAANGVGANGILVEAKNAPALKNAIKFLAQNPALLAQMGAAGRRYAKERFDVKKTIAFYKSALDFRPQDSPRICESVRQSPTPSESGDFDALRRGKKIPKIPKIPKISKTLAFVSNSSFGMYNFRLPVLRALKNDAHAIHIIAPEDRTSELLEREGFVLHRVKMDSKGLNPLKDLRLLLKIRGILREISPQMTFCYTIKCVIYGGFAARILGLNYIAVITGLGYVFIGRGAAKRALRTLVCWMFKLALGAARRVWFLNGDDRAEFLARRIIGAKSAEILDSEGVDLVHFSPESLRLSPARFAQNFAQGFAQRFAKNEGEIAFVLIARMLWDKGVGEFVEAARMIKNEALEGAKNAENGGNNENGEIASGGGHYRFYLLGACDVANPSAISRAQIAAWEREGLVNYLGESSDVREIIAACDCVVLPTAYKEGVPRVLLEAMAMQKPIITTNAAGARECVVPPFEKAPDLSNAGAEILIGQNGVLCEVKNAQSLKNAIYYIGGLEPRARRKLGEASRKIAQRFDINNVVEKYKSSVAEI